MTQIPDRAQGLAPDSPGEPEVLVGATPAAAAALAAERLVVAIDAAVARRGRADIATTGGSTCPALYRALLARPLRDRIPWDRLHIWFGDDRFVPRRDPASNLEAVDSVLLAGDAAAGLEPASTRSPSTRRSPAAAARRMRPSRTRPSCATSSRPMPPGGQSSMR